MKALALLGLAILVSAAIGKGENPSDTSSDHDATVDVLLGEFKKAALKESVEDLDLGGKRFTWTDFAGWGKELFHNGYIKRPPIGEAPSKKISKYQMYTCARCHNHAREDPILSKQDPNERYAWIAENGSDLRLVQGTTVWGIVNRETFYNGHYSKYEDLLIPNDSHAKPEEETCEDSSECRKWQKNSLKDAIQVCSFYCSEGNSFLAAWKVLSIEVYFWDLELKLTDVDLSDERQRAISKVLSKPGRYTAEQVSAAKKELRSSYLLRSNSTGRIPPPEEENHFVGRKEQTPEALIPLGEKIYAISCAICHFQGSEISDDWGGDLGFDAQHFHKVLARSKRTTIRQPYMPEYTVERLSTKQEKAILAYLQSLNAD